LVGKRFSGNASTTAFTLDVAPSSTLDIEVFVENVRQDPNSAYSLSGTTLTFAAAPPSGTNNIYVIHQAKAVGTITAGAGTVNADSFDNTVISGHTALTSPPATTDEFLISDAGTIKRIDYSVLGSTPAFQAYGSGSDQTISDATATKVTVFNTEEYDTNSMFASNRFTPTIAGKYFCYANLYWDTGTSNDFHNGSVSLRKNGTNICAITNNWNASGGNAMGNHVGAVVEFNGSSDYVEVYCYQNTASGNSSTVYASQSNSSFGAYRIIGI
jgi:hypothetical protein